ncbi:Rpn family recombination-promoting nuclease/putative transposase [Lachnospiraceae bacterium ZAX-1]
MKSVNTLEEDRLKEVWEGLDISNNFMFFRVMQKEGICKRLIEILLDVKVSKIVHHEQEHVIDNKKDGKAVRLDVYLEDTDRVFNLEMQVGENNNLAKRSRYYQAMIDLDLLDSGDDYNTLKASVVVFICRFDPFGEGMAEYLFENSCIGDKKVIKLGDLTRKVFYNAPAFSKMSKKDVSDFLRFVCGEAVEDNPFIREIVNEVKEIKRRDEWREEFMRTSMIEMDAELRGEQKGIQIGKQEGIQLGKQEGIYKSIEIMRDFSASEENIVSQLMEKFSLTKEESENYLSDFNNGVLKVKKISSF